MKRTVLLLLCVLSIAACSGSGDDDDDGGTETPTPTPAADATFTLNGSGFQVAHVGFTAFVRVLDAGSVVFCQESAPITAGGTFTVTSVGGSPADVLADGTDYTVELYANIDGTAVYQTNVENPGNPDHIYTFPTGAVAGDVVIDFPHGIQATSITWPVNTGCP